MRPGEYLRRTEIDGKCYLTDREGELCIPCDGGVVVKCSDIIASTQRLLAPNYLEERAIELAEQRGVDVADLTLALGLPEGDSTEYRAPVLELIGLDATARTADVVIVTRASWVDLLAKLPEGLEAQQYVFSDVTNPDTDGMLIRLSGKWSAIFQAADAIGVENSVFDVRNEYGHFVVKTSGGTGSVWFNNVRIH